MGRTRPTTTPSSREREDADEDGDGRAGEQEDPGGGELHGIHHRAFPTTTRLGGWNTAGCALTPARERLRPERAERGALEAEQP